VQIDKASYALQGLPPAWARQLQTSSSDHALALADFQTGQHGPRAVRSSMSPIRSPSSSSKKSDPLPKSKSWSDIRRKPSKASVERNVDPTLLYKDIVEIAEGETGSLYSATVISAPRTTVAIKRIQLADRQNVDKKMNEMEIMKQCQHPNIIKYLAHHLTSTELWVNFQLSIMFPMRLLPRGFFLFTDSSRFRL
jgi:hypothetical protein